MKTLVSLSAMHPSVYRHYVKGWDKSRYADLFAKYTTDRRAYRIYLEPGVHNLASDTLTYDSIPEPVRDEIESAGCVIEDYVGGYATDKHGRKVRIGKILKSQRAKVLFESDERRATSKSAYVCVISRHPYDIAGMSTDRGWTSCTHLPTQIPKSKPSRGKKPDKTPLPHTLGGENAHTVKPTIEVGALIAYFIRRDDKNIKDPAARMLLKVYSDSNGSTMLYPSSIYGTASPAFKSTIETWVNEVNKNYFHVKNYTKYELAEGQYDDTSDPYGGILAMPSSVSDPTALREALDACESFRSWGDLAVRAVSAVRDAASFEVTKRGVIMSLDSRPEAKITLLIGIVSGVLADDEDDTASVKNQEALTLALCNHILSSGPLKASTKAATEIASLDDSPLRLLLLTGVVKPKPKLTFDTIAYVMLALWLCAPGAFNISRLISRESRSDTTVKLFKHKVSVSVALLCIFGALRSLNPSARHTTKTFKALMLDFLQTTHTSGDDWLSAVVSVLCALRQSSWNVNKAIRSVAVFVSSLSAESRKRMYEIVRNKQRADSKTILAQIATRFDKNIAKVHVIRDAGARIIPMLGDDILNLEEEAPELVKVLTATPLVKGKSVSMFDPLPDLATLTYGKTSAYVKSASVLQSHTDTVLGEALNSMLDSAANVQSTFDALAGVPASIMQGSTMTASQLSASMLLASNLMLARYEYLSEHTNASLRLDAISASWPKNVNVTMNSPVDEASVVSSCTELATRVVLGVMQDKQLIEAKAASGILHSLVRGSSSDIKNAVAYAYALACSDFPISSILSVIRGPDDQGADVAALLEPRLRHIALMQGTISTASESYGAAVEEVLRHASSGIRMLNRSSDPTAMDDIYGFVVPAATEIDSKLKTIEFSKTPEGRAKIRHMLLDFQPSSYGCRRNNLTAYADTEAVLDEAVALNFICRQEADIILGAASMPELGVMESDSSYDLTDRSLSALLRTFSSYKSEFRRQMTEKDGTKIGLKIHLSGDHPYAQARKLERNPGLEPLIYGLSMKPIDSLSRSELLQWIYILTSNEYLKIPSRVRSKLSYSDSDLIQIVNMLKVSAASLARATTYESIVAEKAVPIDLLCANTYAYDRYVKGVAIDILRDYAPHKGMDDLALVRGSFWVWARNPDAVRQANLMQRKSIVNLLINLEPDLSSKILEKINKKLNLQDLRRLLVLNIKAPYADVSDLIDFV